MILSPSNLIKFMISIRKLISCGYILIFILIGMIIYCYQYEWKKLEILEKENRTTDELRRHVNELNFRLTGFSLLGETNIGMGR